MTESIAKCYPLQNPEHPARVIEGEAVIVSPGDSKLHSLNEVATFIWERADGSKTLEDIVEELCRTFEIDRERAMRDAESFVQTCLEKRVLLLGERPATSPGRT